MEIVLFLFLMAATLIFADLAMKHEKKLWFRLVLMVVTGAMMYTTVLLFKNFECRWPMFIGLGLIVFLTGKWTDIKLNPMFPISFLAFLALGNILGFKYDMNGPLIIVSVIELFALLALGCVLAGGNKSLDSAKYDSKGENQTEEK
ncbi:MAG: hypothetical protein J6X42_00295 [Alphaproteobacteria bacterium]|nr:hypothetical protein [Alphaproteobacteria bacterium]